MAVVFKWTNLKIQINNKIQVNDDDIVNDEKLHTFNKTFKNYFKFVARLRSLILL